MGEEKNNKSPFTKILFNLIGSQTFYLHTHRHTPIHTHSNTHTQISTHSNSPYVPLNLRHVGHKNV